MSNLVGKNVLIVDEVDDTRTTLEYAVRELEKDVEAAGERVGWKGEKTRFSVFVLHVSFWTFSHLDGLRKAEGKENVADRLNSLVISRTKINRKKATSPRT